MSFPILRIALIGTVLACQSGEEDGYSLAGNASNLQSFGEEADLVLEYRVSYGPGELPPSFTYHGPAALGSNGLMLLRSHTDCKFAVLQLLTGTVLRYTGRCGDGPHETRAIAGAGLAHDSILFADPRSNTLRLIGPSDTVGRRLRVPSLSANGARGVFGLSVLTDTTVFVSLSVAGAPGQEVLAPLFGFVDLRTGEFQGVEYREPLARRETAREGDRFYHACAHASSQIVIVENNGPAEFVGVGRDGIVKWARRTRVESINPRFADTEGSGSAAFQWNRLPLRPACSKRGIFTRVHPLQGPDASRPLGNAVIVDYDGNVLLNAPFTPDDTLLVQANWFADDSTLYIAATQAPSPRVMAFWLRPRRPGEVGVFVVPDSVRAALERDLLGPAPVGVP